MDSLPPWKKASSAGSVSTKNKTKPWHLTAQVIKTKNYFS
jgi:hypothetical protein